MAAMLSVILYNIGHYVLEIALDIRNKKFIFTEELTIGTFWGQVQFLFLFLSRSNKCNPTNKIKRVVIDHWCL